MPDQPSTTTPRVIFRYENNASGRAWLNEVGATFATIAGNVCGQVFLEAVENSGGRRIIIRPRTAAEIARDQCNAYAGPTSWSDATPAGEMVYTCGSSPRPHTTRSRLDAWLDLPGRPVMGTGTGSDSEVAFESGIWHSGAVCGGMGSGANDDEILFHELVHALRQIRGLMHCAPMYGNYDTQEEFFAIVVANIYVGCKVPAPGDASLIRESHSGFSPIAVEPRAWLDSHRRNRAYLDQMRRQMPDLWGNLSRIPWSQCWFNPVRQVAYPHDPAPGSTIDVGTVEFEDEVQG
jgi:hypothetical protein